MQYVDVAVVLVAIVAALILGFGAGAPLLEDRPREALSISLAMIWPLMLWLQQTTATTILGQGAEEYRRVLVASAWTRHARGGWSRTSSARSGAAGSCWARWPSAPSACCWSSGT